MEGMKEGRKGRYGEEEGKVWRGGREGMERRK